MKHTYQIVSLKHQLLVEISILILPKHTGANNLRWILVELLKRNGSNSTPDATGYLTAGEPNEIRNREELSLWFFVTRSYLEGKQEEEEEGRAKEMVDTTRKTSAESTTNIHTMTRHTTEYTHKYLSVCKNHWVLHRHAFELNNSNNINRPTLDV